MQPSIRPVDGDKMTAGQEETTEERNRLSHGAGPLNSLRERYDLDCEWVMRR